MKTVLLVHNYYRHPGGEDQVFVAEGELLEEHGHRVLRFCIDGSQIRRHSSLGLAIKSIWNTRVYCTIREIIKKEKVDVVHFHNTVPLVSPSAYYAAKREGAAVVQTLHNYRFLCPEAMFFRCGKVCELCLGCTFSWPAVAHACYQQSRAASLALSSILAIHTILGTYRNKIDKFIALTHFAKDKMVKGGFVNEQISIKPNFVLKDPGQADGKKCFALFVGRLSEEKGITTLLDAWALLKGVPPLKIAGDGPLYNYVSERIRKIPSVELLGFQSHPSIIQLMKSASFVVVPSLWYEGFPMTIAEAFSTGLPVFCSRLGSMADIVEDTVTGMQFAVGNPIDLAAKVTWFVNNTAKQIDMRNAARRAYIKHYNSESNYQMLLDIYEQACSYSTADIRIH
jgi:glycosyltransferase involved in cell wall biosynthesis